MGVWAQRSEKESNLRNLMLSHKRSTTELSLLVGPTRRPGAESPGGRVDRVYYFTT